MFKTAISIAALCVVSIVAAKAIESGVDWKLYGAAIGKQQCFYDVESVSFQSVGHLRVWTKCLSEQEMNEIKDPDAEVVKRAASKLTAGYQPPITAFMKLSDDQVMTIVLFEAIADMAPLEPDVRIYWEIGCSEKMIRAIDIRTRDGRHGSIAKWDYVAPETNAGRLLKMVCN